MRKKFFALVVILWASLAWAQTPVEREAAYRANNRGVALLEQYKHKEGAAEFRRALAIVPTMYLARLNLAIALANVPDLPAARQEAEAALKLKPDAPHALYVLGLVAKSESRAEDALALFQRVLALDPDDPGANINAGQLLAQQRQYAEAAALFRRAVAVEPYNTSALYGLGQALLRAGARDEGQTIMRTFQKYRQNGAGTTLSNNYLEQGRYAEALASTGAESDLVDTEIPAVRFYAKDVKLSNTTIRASTRNPPVPKRGKLKKRNGELPKTPLTLAASFSGKPTLFDFDDDGDLDLLQTRPQQLRLFRNDAGNFTEITAQTGALAEKGRAVSIAAVAGDYDNDGKNDLFVLGYGGCTLYRNEGRGKFSNQTVSAKIPHYPFLAVTTAFVDIDHDGDLDIFIAGYADVTKPQKDDEIGYAHAPNLLLRNNGNGSFEDVTDSAQLKTSGGHAVSIVPTDFDNRRDVDLLIANYNAPPTLFRNLRDATFRDVTSEVGLSGQKTGSFYSGVTNVAAGDVNKDGFTDFFFCNKFLRGGFALSDGQGRFILTTVALKLWDAAANAKVVKSEDATALLFDYDNDGLLDLLVFSSQATRIFRNFGNDWKIASGRGVDLSALSLPRENFAAGDVDGDGDTDFIPGSAESDPLILVNDGGNRNASVKVNLKGFVGNRSGIGAKVDIRAGSLGQKLEYYSASPAPAPSDLVFGLGKRKTADAVRIVWPSGIVQAEVEGLDTLARKPLTVTELDLKPSSCPYLYAWNGERFEFITDFMGGGEMGYWEAPGLYNHPDPDEYVRITDKQLQPKDGRYEIRVTNELEEVLFVDHLRLIAVAHPSDTEVYPDEGLGHAPYPSPLKLYQTKGAQPPIAAVDDTGADVLHELTALDRKYPSNFVLDKVRGYAGEHSLTLRLPAKASQMPDAKEQIPKHTILLLTGWTDYAFSSDNVAAAQAAKAMKPPALQVKDKTGNWQTVINDIGIPIGRPQTVTVDLTGKFLSESREIRIVTNMRVYYDQILFGMWHLECGLQNCSDGNELQVKELAPIVADLHWRGYSAETSPDGKAPYSYDYTKVSWASPWKVAPGRYTREGDVSELLAQSDDNFVISRTGDELRLSFDAKRLPALPAGWKRTFLLYADGFSKELDINSATPHAVGPLPFHGMTKYPYDWPETYPLTPKREALMERYHRRVVAREIGL